jgi:hypothetical protein
MDWEAVAAAGGRVVRWLVKAAIVAVILFVLLIAAVQIDEKVDLEYLSTKAANAALMGFALVAIGALLYFLLRALARLFLSPRSWQLFGADPVARLVALGIVTYFFPQAIVSFITVPVTVAIQLVNDLPRIVKALLDDAPSAMPLDVVLARAAWIAESVGFELSRAASALFDRLRIAELIFAAALWALLGHLLGAGNGAGNSERMRVLGLLRGLSEPQQRIASLAVIFLIGIYLSTAAIVAIPWLADDKGQQGFTRAELEKALGWLTPKAGAKDPAPTLPPNPAEHLASIVQSLEDVRKHAEAERASKQVPFSVGPITLDQLDSMAREAKRRRDSAAEYHNQLRDDFIDRRSQVAGEALAAFDAETAVPMNRQERAFFFHDIQRSTREQIHYMERALRECNRNIGDADKQFASVAGVMAAAAKVADGTYPAQSRELHDRLRDLEGLARKAEGVCRQPAFGSLRVEAREPGIGWGPFALVSQWLLKTRSQELALITGMFGFGLLGSAVVTFVRPRSAVSPAQAAFNTVAGEVASIVARGLSAAIVVFLAVKGGLAIFTSGETEPNAYVLFFTCLVGAVFSENVWEWARKRLSEQLPKQVAATTDAGKAKKRGAAPIRKRGDS